MAILLFSLMVLFFGGLGSVILNKKSELSFKVGSYSAVIGSITGLVSILIIFLSGRNETLVFNWSIPGSQIAFGVDGLSAFFVAIIFLLSALSGLYGFGYLDNKNKKSGRSWFWFNSLVISMIFVVSSRNTILFLISWEIMSLTSFFLVAFDGENESVRNSAWTYFIATHIGTAFLVAMFLMAASISGTFDFSGFEKIANNKNYANLFFVFAVIGFGVKAGFFPLHVWLPEAHPAAPSHVSALMSGVMIKTGIYALLRFTLLMGQVPAWWGITLVIIGILSGLLGVIFALAQHDIKRLLAYHSMENIGIISLGLGIGLLGISYNQPVVAFLGIAGGLLHVLNHALFKSLLFFSAGAVVHSVHERNIEQLGGLMKKMPVTGTAFLVGAVAICGLPPLNGFISELLIYFASVKGILTEHYRVIITAVSVIISLVLIGGLAVACFAKAFGVIFLGEPRNKIVSAAKDPGLSMKLPMIIISVLCFAIGFFPQLLISVLAQVFKTTNGLSSYLLPEGILASMQKISFFSFFLFVLVASIAGIRKYLLRNSKKTETVTWDCGYVRPTSRMQYTASSFAQPFTSMFSFLLKLSFDKKIPENLFPQNKHFRSHSKDIAQELIFNPFFKRVYFLLLRLQKIQEGRVQIYVLYMAVTLLLLLIFGR